MGILDQVTRACEADEEYLKCLIWGTNGSGKSTLCGTAPAPSLYLYTERQGLLSFQRRNPNGDVLPIRSVDDLRQVLMELRGGKHRYKSVCLDSFTEMQVLISDEIVARKPRDPSEPVKITQEEYMFIHDRSKGLVRAFRDLPMHVVVTCLAETVVLGDDRSGQVVTRVMLTGKKLPAQMGAFFNLVGFTYRISGPDGSTAYRVLFEGRSDIETKGMPGLRKREEPDVAYWLQRALRGAPSRDPSAPMIVDVEAYGVPVLEADMPQEGPEDEGEV